MQDNIWFQFKIANLSKSEINLSVYCSPSVTVSAPVCDADGPPPNPLVSNQSLINHIPHLSISDHTVPPILDYQSPPPHLPSPPSNPPPSHQQRHCFPADPTCSLPVLNYPPPSHPPCTLILFCPTTFLGCFFHNRLKHFFVVFI